MGTVPSGWRPDRWRPRAPSGKDLFLDLLHLPPYRHCSSAPASPRWCGLACQTKQTRYGSTATQPITLVRVGAKGNTFLSSLPGHTPSLHVIGQRDIMWPDVILPFLEADHAAQDISRMHTDTHADVDPGGVSHLPVILEETGFDYFGHIWQEKKM